MRELLSRFADEVSLPEMVTEARADVGNESTPVVQAQTFEC
jgi:hypothetical protein